MQANVSSHRAGVLATDGQADTGSLNSGVFPPQSLERLKQQCLILGLDAHARVLDHQTQASAKHVRVQPHAAPDGVVFLGIRQQVDHYLTQPPRIRHHGHPLGRRHNLKGQALLADREPHHFGTFIHDLGNIGRHQLHAPGIDLNG